MNRQTFIAKNQEVPRQWLAVDATDQVLGRLAVRLAVILMGKHKPQYTPHHDVGDFIVVTHAEKIRLTGQKLDQKFHNVFTGHPGGLKQYSYRWMLENRPERLITLAVQRMLPKNKLGQHDWMEAVRQSVIKPKSAIGGPRTPNFVFKFDFYLPGPTPMFDALFPHSSHTQWLDCSSCHPKIFRYRGTKITMQDIRERKYCGVCHGPVAFPADADNCGRCHTAMMPPE